MRDRLIELLEKAQNEWLKKEYDHETDKTLAEYTTDYLLENDIVKVVRCMDCKHYYESYYANGKVFRRECRLRSTGCGYGDVLLKTDNGYCSFGELKESNYETK